MEIKLSDEQVAVLRVVLQSVCIKSRTGELGVTHGLDRFVSTNRTLKTAERDLLDEVARKVGLSAGVSRHQGQTASSLTVFR